MKKIRFVSAVCAISALALACGCAAPGIAGDEGFNNAPDASDMWYGSDAWLAEGEGNYQYDSVLEQGFYDAAEAPSSYFSLDRNTAGYSLVRAQINAGMRVAADSVRLEELVNYFDYDYPAPAEGETFGISAYLADCPWNAEHKLMTVGLKTEEARSTGDANYVLLVDVSGSMSGDRINLVKYGANKLVDGLGERDRVAIVTYASGVQTVLESTAATEAGKTAIRSAIASLSAYGSTSGSDGLQRAYEQAEAHRAENGNNRVIILTDGDFKVGISDTAQLTEFIQEKAKSGIALSVVGVGLGNTRDDLMQTLALNGNGNYCYIDSQTEAEKVFTQELAGMLYTVAHDAKAGVTFNADMVSSYRLLGYDMKTMTEDDFNNSEKDAGEIGSNLCVTVMYEIVPAASDMGGTEGALADVTVRYRTTQGEDAEATLTVTGSEGETDDARFAACVAEFALVLRQSRYCADASLAKVAERLNALGDYVEGDVYKREFAQLVTLAIQSEHYDLPSEDEGAQDGV